MTNDQVEHMKRHINKNREDAGYYDLIHTGKTSEEVIILFEDALQEAYNVFGLDEESTDRLVLKAIRELREPHDPCTVCHRSTAFGFGLFVDRIPSEDDWMCADCQQVECDTCKIKTLDYRIVDSRIECADCWERYARTLYQAL